MNIDKMKNFFQKVYSRYRWQSILTIILLVAILFLLNDNFLYDQPIAKVVKVKTEESGKVSNYSNGSFAISEKSYEQHLTLKILNTKNSGKRIKAVNKFTFSQTDSQKLYLGDRVFIKLNDKGKLHSCTITDVKRDSYAFILLAIFVWLVLLMAGKRGALILFTLTANIVIFTFALFQYFKGVNILLIANILIVIFPILTLIISNGARRQTFIAILSSFITLGVAMMLFHLSMTYGEEIDYANLDYIVGNQDLEQIFFASVALAGLGAVMDVAVTISSALEELVVKTPGIKTIELFKAGRQIGYDIMGTMINVLLFTYMCGLIPLIIIKMRNNLSLFTIIRLQIPFEICRFLIGGIEILLTIPVAIAISALMLKIRRRHHD